MKTNLRILSALAALIMAAISPIHAQRNLHGGHGIQLTGGMVDGLLLRNADMEKRFFIAADWSVINANQSRWVAGVAYLHKDYTYGSQIIPKAQYTAQAGYFVPILADRRRNVCLSAGLAAVLGYETSNRGDKLLHDGATLRNKDCFIYGAAIGAELEVYITDTVILLAAVRERMLFGSTFGQFHLQTGFGIKFIIN